jgi:hypothetical protein
MAKPPRAAGGVAAELGVVDPRRAVREKTNDPPVKIQEKRPRPMRALDEDDEADPYVTALQIKPRDGAKHSRSTKVRAYHRTGKRGAERCWMFTMTRRGYEFLLAERRFDHREATYPDGRPVVPKGADPLNYPMACGSCGTHSVECLQIEFLRD